MSCARCSATYSTEGDPTIPMVPFWILRSASFEFLEAQVSRASDAKSAGVQRAKHPWGRKLLYPARHRSRTHCVLQSQKTKLAILARTPAMVVVAGPGRLASSAFSRPSCPESESASIATEISSGAPPTRLQHQSECQPRDPSKGATDRERYPLFGVDVNHNPPSRE